MFDDDNGLFGANNKRSGPSDLDGLDTFGGCQLLDRRVGLTAIGRCIPHSPMPHACMQNLHAPGSQGHRQTGKHGGQRNQRGRHPSET